MESQILSVDNSRRLSQSFRACCSFGLLLILYLMALVVSRVFLICEVDLISKDWSKLYFWSFVVKVETLGISEMWAKHDGLSMALLHRLLGFDEKLKKEEAIKADELMITATERKRKMDLEMGFWGLSRRD